jgi:hypothetical protein
MAKRNSVSRRSSKKDTAAMCGQFNIIETEPALCECRYAALVIMADAVEIVPTEPAEQRFG